MNMWVLAWLKFLTILTNQGAQQDNMDEATC